MSFGGLAEGDNGRHFPLGGAPLVLPAWCPWKGSPWGFGPSTPAAEEQLRAGPLGPFPNPLPRNQGSSLSPEARA